MWRRSNLPGNPDSDQSISEDEEEEVQVDGSLLCPPSGKSTEEGGGLLLQTKFDKLKGISSSLEDDDVEVPDSPEESCFASSRRDELTCISTHETVSDDEIPQVATWSTISKETKSLIRLNGIASVSSSHSSGFRAKRGSKVVKDNVRPKFSFHAPTHGETSSKISDMVEYFEPADDDQAMEEDPIAECSNDLDELSKNRLCGVSAAESREVLHGYTEDTVSKLLLMPPPHKIRVTKRSSKPCSRRGGEILKVSHRGSSSNIQDSDTTDDELPGPMDGESSSDDEPEETVPNISNLKKQFVGDRFDEAVKASSLSKEGPSFDSPKLSGGSSLYGKLQQIMKQEKETEIEILRKLQGGIGRADASSYVDIKVVSRHLEGKLVVCKCSVIDLFGDSLLLKNTQSLAAKDTESTIIFDPKVCTDVDMEIGGFVRLYAPWKEMEMKNTKEVIILCSYFSTL